MNKRSSKAMMIVLFVFLWLATSLLIWSLEYQITSPENRSIENLPAHDNHEDIELTYIHSPISKVSSGSSWSCHSINRIHCFCNYLHQT